MTPRILLHLFYSDMVVLGCDTFASVFLIGLRWTHIWTCVKTEFKIKCDSLSQNQGFIDTKCLHSILPLSYKMKNK